MRESLKPYEKDKVIQIHNELENSKDNQRALILITSSYLEMMVNFLVEKKCKNYKKIRKENEFSYFFKLLLLNEIGLIDDNFYRRLEKFRDIRNGFSHNPLYKITEKNIGELSNNQYSKLDDFYSVCNILWIELWNQYQDIFAPKFLPTAFIKKQK